MYWSRRRRRRGNDLRTAMHRLDFLLLIVIAYAGFDLFRTLRTGRAHTWMNGTATRERQPGRY